MRTVLSALLALAVFAAMPLAQTARQLRVTAIVSGVVDDESGAALPGATVTLVTPAGNRLTAKTDAFGKFQFRVPPGACQIEVAAPGHVTDRRAITASLTAAATVSVTMRPALAGLGRRGGVATRAMPPPPTQLPITPPPPTIAMAKAPTDLARIPVFYATDRAKSPGTTLDFGPERNPASTLFLGRFDVSIPRDHRAGQIERPTIWTFYRESIDQHFVIVNRQETSYEDFYSQLHSAVDKSEAKEALVFIHGFNVAFDDAIYRTAQLSYDLGFDGAAIAYSWPSENRVLAYSVDEVNNEWTVDHLRWFLEDVSAKSGALKIHLIAHSMGNRALAYALKAMGESSTPMPRPHFQDIVLTAPDIDAGVFQQISNVIRSNGERTTLYVSSKDMALLASKTYQHYRRAGDSADGVLVVNGIDTVDVSALSTDFLGHSYFGDNTSVLSDLLQLVLRGLAPPGRKPLVSHGQAPQLYWIFPGS